MLFGDIPHFQTHLCDLCNFPHRLSTKVGQIILVIGSTNGTEPYPATASRAVAKDDHLISKLPLIQGTIPRQSVLEKTMFLLVFFTERTYEQIGWPFNHRIGLWENLQENPIFGGKNDGFRRFSLKTIH